MRPFRGFHRPDNYFCVLLTTPTTAVKMFDVLSTSQPALLHLGSKLDRIVTSDVFAANLLALPHFGMK